VSLASFVLWNGVVIVVVFTQAFHTSPKFKNRFCSRALFSHERTLDEEKSDRCWLALSRSFGDRQESEECRLKMLLRLQADFCSEETKSMKNFVSKGLKVPALQGLTQQAIVAPPSESVGEVPSTVSRNAISESFRNRVCSILAVFYELFSSRKAHA
jgi:hypothetical protein